MYKVGDKVRIKSIDWYNKNKDKDGIVELSTHVFIPEMVEHCGKVAIIKNVFEDTDDNVVYYMEDIVWDWTDEMIECKVEEETKPEPKFKVGDRIITDTNMKGKIIEIVEKGWYHVEFEPYNEIPQPNGIVPEENMSLVEEEVGLVDVFSSRWINEFNLPNGYVFKDENGNVINATKIVLEKKNNDKLKLKKSENIGVSMLEFL